MVEQVCLLLPGTGRRVSAVTAWHRVHGIGAAAGMLARLLREQGVRPPGGLDGERVAITAGPLGLVADGAAVARGSAC